LICRSPRQAGTLSTLFNVCRESDRYSTSPRPAGIDKRYAAGCAIKTIFNLRNVNNSCEEFNKYHDDMNEQILDSERRNQATSRRSIIRPVKVLVELETKSELDLCS
jgi:hypothetical protein